jgi:hypothetical protein
VSARDSHQTRGRVLRGLSDGALAIMTGAGLIGVTAVGMYARGLWKIGLIFATLVAFGSLGIFDRSDIRPPWLMSLVRATASVLAAVSAFALLFFVLEFLLRHLKP